MAHARLAGHLPQRPRRRRGVRGDAGTGADRAARGVLGDTGSAGADARDRWHPPRLIEQFSTRRAAVLATYERLLTEWYAIHGRTPTHAERSGMLDEATVRSRFRKSGGDCDLHEQWRSVVSDAELIALGQTMGIGVDISDGGRLPAGSPDLRSVCSPSCTSNGHGGPGPTSPVKSPA